MTDVAPGPIEPSRTSKLASGLYAESFVPSGTPRGVVVVSHGYAEHCGRYREVANVIVRAGWAAIAYDVRGHGHSPGKRGAIDRFQTYLDDLAIVEASARTMAASDAPLVLLGHSHGSLITLRALADERAPKNIARAIVTSPFLALRMKVPGYKKLLARVGSVLAPNLAQPNALRVEDLTSDPQKQAERTADTLCFDVATARWFTEAAAAQAYVYAHADRIAVPTTWLVGGADPIADPDRSKQVAARTPGADYHAFPTMKHEVLNEVDRATVFALVTAALASAAPQRTAASI